MSLPADVRAQLDDMFQHLFAEMDNLIRREVPKAFGQAWRGGKLDARFISQFIFTLLGVADAHGKTPASQMEFPDNHTLTTYQAVSSVPAPTHAPTLTNSAASTTLTAGTYVLAICWNTPQGQTLLSPATSITIAAGDKIHVVANDSMPTGANGMAVYQITDAPAVGYSPALYS